MVKPFHLTRLGRSLSFNSKSSQTQNQSPEEDYFHNAIKIKKPSICSAPVSPQISNAKATNTWNVIPSIQVSDVEVPGLMSDQESVRDHPLTSIKSHDHLEVPSLHPLHQVDTIDEDTESMLSLTPNAHNYPMPIIGDHRRCDSMLSMESSLEGPCYHEPVFDVMFDNSSPLDGINPLNNQVDNLSHNQRAVNLAPVGDVRLVRSPSTFTGELVKLPNKINKRVKHRTKKVEAFDSELERFQTATNSACMEMVSSPSELAKKKSFTNRVVHRVFRPFRH